MDDSRTLPLLTRFPDLARLERAGFGRFPSPVARVEGDRLALRGELWLKRDDLNAKPTPGTPTCGGNKLRGLDFLLGDVGEGHVLVTVGGEGSTHVLATAILARQRGTPTVAVRWRHEMNPMARAVAARVRAELAGGRIVRTAPGALAAARLASGASRAAPGSRVRRIPAGGTSALAMLGHVNAGLELADQVRRGELPEPERVVLPLGTGGTTAGLALGFTLAGLRTRIVAVRVVPRVAVGRWRVLARARSCARLITRLTGAALPRVTADRVEVRDDWYGGAYGRAVPAAREAAVLLERAAGVRLDDTYSAKAFGAALDLARNRAGPTLFWVTFDPSPMDAVRDAPALAGAAGATP